MHVFFYFVLHFVISGFRLSHTYLFQVFISRYMHKYLKQKSWNGQYSNQNKNKTRNR